MNYKIIPSFWSRYTERLGVENENLKDVETFILNKLYYIQPYIKLDNKGVLTEYFTFKINNKLATIIVDSNTKKVVTCIEEKYKRKKFFKPDSERKRNN